MLLSRPRWPARQALAGQLIRGPQVARGRPLIGPNTHMSCRHEVILMNSFRVIDVGRWSKKRIEKRTGFLLLTLYVDNTFNVVSYS